MKTRFEKRGGEVIWILRLQLQETGTFQTRYKSRKTDLLKLREKIEFCQKRCQNYLKVKRRERIRDRPEAVQKDENLKTVQDFHLHHATSIEFKSSNINQFEKKI